MLSKRVFIVIALTFIQLSLSSTENDFESNLENFMEDKEKLVKEILTKPEEEEKFLSFLKDGKQDDKKKKDSDNYTPEYKRQIDLWNYINEIHDQVRKESKEHSRTPMIDAYLKFLDESDFPLRDAAIIAYEKLKKFIRRK